MEVLTAAAVLSVLGLPVFMLTVRNARSLSGDRVRLVADQLARSTVERYGLAREAVADLVALTADPAVLACDDPWERSPGAYDELAGAPVAPLSALYGLHMKLELIRDLAAGTDLLVCAVSWFPDGDRRRGAVRITHVRALVHDHLHAN